MSWIATNTIAGAAMALVVLGIERWARPRPAVLHVLWMLALLRLCWPPWLGVDLELPWPPADAAASTLTIDLVRGGAVVSPPADPRPALAVPVAGASAGGTLAIAWAVVGGAVALLLGAWIVRCGHRLGAALPAPAWLVTEVGTLSARLGIEAPAIVDERRAASPFVWPFGRPRLVASAGRLAAMPMVSRTAVLAHELAHLRRKDHWWLLLELLLLPAFCWHPLFWLLRARVREQAELACDAWALWAVPGARRPYAEALIQALAHRNPAPAVPVLAARPTAVRAFERRLTMIMTESVPCRASRWSLAGCALLSLGVVLAPVRAQEREPKPRVEITIDGKRLDDLTPQQRQRVLRELGLTGEALELVLKARSIERGEGEPAAKERAAPREAAAPRRRTGAEPRRAQDPAPRGQAGEGQGLERTVRDALHGALSEVERELADDPDLKELGIADEVRALIGAVGGEGSFDGALHDVVDKAIQGAARKAQKEIAADPDLERLGIADGLGRLIGDLAGNKELRQGLLDLAGQAMRSALKEARVEIEADTDLRELGITDEVGALLDDLAEGRLDLEHRLPPLIEKAVQGALRAGRAERGSEPKRRK